MGSKVKYLYFFSAVGKLAFLNTQNILVINIIKKAETIRVPLHRVFCSTYIYTKPNIDTAA